MNKAEVFEKEMNEIIREVKKCVADRKTFGGMIDRAKILEDIERVLEKFVEV